MRAFTLLDCLTHWCTCSPSKVTLTRSQLPTEEIAAGPGMSGRKSWQCRAVQLSVGTSLRCHWSRSRGIPRHLSLWSSPRLGFLHLNRLYAGAQCMIGLLVGGSASRPVLSGEFSTYHFCLGQVLSKHTTNPYWLWLASRLVLGSSKVQFSTLYTQLPVTCQHSQSKLSFTYHACPTLML